MIRLAPSGRSSNRVDLVIGAVEAVVAVAPSAGCWEEDALFDKFSGMTLSMQHQE